MRFNMLRSFALALLCMLFITENAVADYHGVPIKRARLKKNSTPATNNAADSENKRSTATIETTFKAQNNLSLKSDTTTLIFSLDGKNPKEGEINLETSSNIAHARILVSSASEGKLIHEQKDIKASIPFTIKLENGTTLISPKKEVKEVLVESTGAGKNTHKVILTVDDSTPTLPAGKFEGNVTFEITNL